MADDVTPRCLKAKSANTLWLKNEEKLCADNTDGTGLIRDLSHHLSLIDKRVLLLGAGGAARGIIEPLLASGITKLTLINRTKEKLFILKNDFPAIEIADQDTLKARFDLIINATSASLTASQNKLISAKILQNQPYCYDLAYNLHKQTPFVAFARAHGCVADDGLGMLVEQAAEAFLIWHGFKPDTNTVLTALQR
ncbi:shikimate 5-dehydrogenase [Legionella beliardensis]|uniref:Shikimate 5-dehydrogenase n=2 Tax=Legionella beliardensis TaxID=91822 RepID=A0A378I4G8_9GAMM|nr:shikimate 5-dehydrogenase [Legionella beliardensis]